MKQEKLLLIYAKLNDLNRKLDKAILSIKKTNKELKSIKNEVNVDKIYDSVIEQIYQATKQFKKENIYNGFKKN